MCEHVRCIQAISSLVFPLKQSYLSRSSERQGETLIHDIQNDPFNLEMSLETPPPILYVKDNTALGVSTWPRITGVGAIALLPTPHGVNAGD